MSTELGSVPREATPSNGTTSTAAATGINISLSSAAAPISSSVPQKRVLEDDHTPRPTISSPLNPDVGRATPKPTAGEEIPLKRTKKDTLKKREAKGAYANEAKSGTSAEIKRREAQVHEPPADVPLRYKQPPPKPSDFYPSRGAAFTHHRTVPGPCGEASVEFYETSDHIVNKRNYRYTACIADPAFPSSLLFRQTEPEPYGPHLQFEDSAAHMFFDKTGLCVTTDKGFRLSRANVAVREGRFFWEVKITSGVLRERNDKGEESHGHVRFGFARREAAVDAPVGFDCYSYGIRDKAGHKVFMSRPKEFLPEGQSVCEGDVIGLEIQLPSVDLHHKILAGQYNPVVDGSKPTGEVTLAIGTPNIVRDRALISYKKRRLYFEQIDYHTTKELEDLMSTGLDKPAVGSAIEKPHPNHPLPALRTLPNSHIKIYKNGEFMGTAFEDLLAFLPPASRPSPSGDARDGLDDGMLGYYPAISVFRGGAAQANFGPNFWYPPPDYCNQPNGDRDVDMNGGDEMNDKLPPAGKLMSISERYVEQIAEDVVYDIIDEVDYWMQDGEKIIDQSGVDDLKTAAGQGGLATGGEGIKEVLQDD